MSATEQYCTLLLPEGCGQPKLGEIGEEETLEDHICKKLESNKASKKVEAMKQTIHLMLQGEHLPRVLMK